MTHDVFRVLDKEDHFYIVFNVMQRCSFSSLVALARVNRALREMVFYRFFKKRIDYFIGLYIPQAMIPKFWKLLESSNASIAGSIVRCIISNEMYVHYKKVNPSQLNIIIPKTSPGSDVDNHNFRKWRRFMHSCAFISPSHSTRDISVNFRASTSNWAVLHTNPAGGRRSVSLIESNGSSVFPPLFQAAQTSSFYLMSSTRIYCLYPGLHEHGFNLSLKPSGYSDLFDNFNYGLLNFRSTENWQIFSGTCGEACPSLHRTTKNFSGFIVFRWGGINMDKDDGNTVSIPDPYNEKVYAWKLDGECTKQRCENFLLSVDHYDEYF